MKKEKPYFKNIRLPKAPPTIVMKSDKLSKYKYDPMTELREYEETNDTD